MSALAGEGFIFDPLLGHSWGEMGKHWGGSIICAQAPAVIISPGARSTENMPQGQKRRGKEPRGEDDGGERGRRIH